jgi:hypothetical protein
VGSETQALDYRLELSVDVVPGGASRFERAKRGRIEQAGLTGAADRGPCRVGECALGLDPSRERGRSEAPHAPEPRAQPRDRNSFRVIDELASQRAGKRDGGEMHLGHGAGTIEKRHREAGAGSGRAVRPYRTAREFRTLPVPDQPPSQRELPRGST